MVNFNETVTMPREVVELVIEALEYAFRRNGDEDCYANAIKGLRIALDQSNRQSAHESELMMNDVSYRRKFEQPQAEQEPVGFVRQIDIEQIAKTPSDWGAMFGRVMGFNTVPVYTHPQPKRDPLCEDEGCPHHGKLMCALTEGTNMLTPELIHSLALEAGAARFYPEQQSAKQELYLVGQGFLEKFAELVQKHKLQQELEQKYPLKTGTRS